jgi:putative membrane protein
MSGRSIWLTLIALLLLIPITVMVVVMILGVAGYWSHYSYWMPMFGMMSFGWLFMLIPLTFLVILFIIVLIAALRPRSHPFYGGPWGWRGSSYAGDSESILDSRYARGEISRDEYLRMREDLRKG